MTLQLDARRLAMLEEMGLRMFLPPQSPTAFSAPQGAADASAQESAPAQSVPATQDPARAVLASPPDRTPTVRVIPAPLPQGLAGMDWPALDDAVSGCRACGLCETRRNTVFGAGDQRADWLVVGEAPGENEDLQGEPFVGQAGKLLDNMLRALGLDRQRNVYIANAIKCRPPGNRNPQPQEVAQCEPFLRRQVELLQPRLILAMGRFAVQSLLQTPEPIGKLRGRVHAYAGVPLIVTYHPAYLLRNPHEKGKAWSDLCLALEQMEAAQEARAGG